MAKLFWIRTFETIDQETKQEIFVEQAKKLTMAGEIIMYCEVCERWVPRADLHELCHRGLHEQSREVKLEDIEVDKRVGECLEAELKEKART